LISFSKKIDLKAIFSDRSSGRADFISQALGHVITRGIELLAPRQRFVHPFTLAKICVARPKASQVELHSAVGSLAIEVCFLAGRSNIRN
jgi:Na+(H+)/acetate symporter ActP